MNPFGADIIRAPFSFSPEIYSYIKELRETPLSALWSPTLTGFEMSVSSAISIVFIGSVVAFGSLLLRGFRLAPLILSIVGLILLTRGQRFLWEWALLSLPLLRCAINQIEANYEMHSSYKVSASNLALLVLLLTPFVTWYTTATAYTHWPLDHKNLPMGITHFIKSSNIEGKLVATPNVGGYLASRLYPHVLIAADMQTPPSTPWTHFRIESLFRNRHSLQRFIEEYSPELIAVGIKKKSFKHVIVYQPEYRPIFFDDTLVLYANRNLLPELVKRYELAHVNPYNLLDDKHGTLEQRLIEIQRVRDAFPKGDRAQHGIVRLLIGLKRYPDALEAAKSYIETHPENPNSHYLLGNIFEYLGRCNEAVPHYNATFSFSDREFHRIVHEHLGSCAYLNKDFSAAYKHFDIAINSYLRDVEPAHYFQFALSAVAVGKEKRAAILLKHLLHTVDPNDEETIYRARDLLNSL